MKIQPRISFCGELTFCAPKSATAPSAKTLAATLSMLFSSYTRDNYDHKRRKETAFEFLDRSAWGISSLVRDKVNEWAKLYDPDIEFIRMFKSRSVKQHYSATFELLVYTLLRNSGFSLTRHPDTKTDRKPDFLCALNDFKVFIECTLAGHSFDNPAEKNRIDTVEEVVDEIEYFPYWINLFFNKVSEQSVSKKKLLMFLDGLKTISEGVPNEVLFEMKHLFEDNGWAVEIFLIRKDKSDVKRSLGFISGNAKTIYTSKPILTALNDKKASKYGIDTDPYIVCLNTNDLFTKDKCFAEALFGQYAEDEIDLRNLFQNGFFLSKGKAVNTSVSAVVIFRNFDLFTLDNSSVSVWHNPYAKCRVPIDLLPFDEYVYHLQADTLKRTAFQKSKDLFKVLGINKDAYVDSKEDKGS